MSSPNSRSAKIEEAIFDLYIKRTGTKILEKTHRDRPDFWIRTTDDVQIGLEVTEANASEYHQIQKAAKKRGLRSYGLNFLQHNPSKKRRSDEELFETVTNPDMEPTEQAVVAWAWRVADRIRSKTNSFEHPDFEKFDQNILSIYTPQGDDWGLDQGRSLDILMGAIGPDPKLRSTFDQIYILSVGRIYMITKDYFFEHWLTDH